jgi:hypothetical protein
VYPNHFERFTDRGVREPDNEKETGMDKQDKFGVLMKDKEYVKYVQLLRKAEKEGRVDGAHSCSLCGMRYVSREEADECCRITVS